MIKVLADLKKGDSIDMQVLTDLKRVSVRDLAIPNYRVGMHQGAGEIARDRPSRCGIARF